MTQRILFVVKSLFPAGDAHQLQLLTSELAAHGWDIHIAVIDHDDLVEPQWPAHASIHILCQQRESRAAKTIRLRRLLQKLRPSIVHAWDFYSTVSSQLASVGMSVDQISTLLEIPHRRELWFRKTCQWMSKQARITVCHQQISGFLVDNGFVNASHPFHIIPNAINPITADRQNARANLATELGIENRDALIVTTIAEWAPRTRIKDLIWAAALLNCIEYDIHLLIFGAGLQEQSLKTYAEQTNTDKYVHFMHNRPLALQALAGSHAYWHSHLLRPLPTELMMAMACGLPTISVLGDGTESLVLHQQTAFATNFGARDEFARWTKYIVEQAEATEKLAAQAKQNVVNHFPPKRMTESFLDLYQ